MAMFRFEEMEIWKFGSQVSDELFKIADELYDNKKYRFSEQLNGAAMSITNNIAEGSGSVSNKDFANFLNISRRSVFEYANILTILLRRKYVTEETKEILFKELYELSKKIYYFRKSLLR